MNSSIGCNDTVYKLSNGSGTIEAYTKLLLNNRNYDDFALKRMINRETNELISLEKQIITDYDVLYTNAANVIYNEDKKDINNNCSLVNHVMKTDVKVLFAVICSKPYRYSPNATSTPSTVTSCLVSDLLNRYTASSAPVKCRILDSDFLINDSSLNAKFEEGSLVCLLNPTVLLTKKQMNNPMQLSKNGDGTAGSKNNILTKPVIHIDVMSSSQVIIIGHVAHYGICKGYRKSPSTLKIRNNQDIDPYKCTMPVNNSTHEYCVFHGKQASTDNTLAKPSTTAADRVKKVSDIRQSMIRLESSHAIPKSNAILHPVSNPVGKSEEISTGIDYLESLTQDIKSSSSTTNIHHKPPLPQQKRTIQTIDIFSSNAPPTVSRSASATRNNNSAPLPPPPPAAYKNQKWKLAQQLEEEADEGSDSNPLDGDCLRDSCLMVDDEDEGSRSGGNGVNYNLNGSGNSYRSNRSADLIESVDPTNAHTRVRVPQPNDSIFTYGASIYDAKQKLIAKNNAATQPMEVTTTKPTSFEETSQHKLLNSTNIRLATYEKLVNSSNNALLDRHKVAKPATDINRITSNNSNGIIAVGNSGRLLDVNDLLTNSRQYMDIQKKHNSGATVMDLMELNSIDGDSNGKQNKQKMSNQEFSRKRKIEEDMLQNQKQMEKNQQILKQQKLDAKIDALLNRSSSHATEEHHEWFDGLHKKMDRWEAQEYVISKENQRTKNGIQINGFYCLNCKRCHEKQENVCQNIGHKCTAATLLKRYFECNICLRRTSTLSAINSRDIHDAKSNASSTNALDTTSTVTKSLVPLGAIPTYNCEYCNKSNTWVPCGRSGSYYLGGTKQSNMSIAKEISINNRNSSICSNDYYNHT